MAEIEFKRRGTPVWAVLLVLVVVAGIVWAFVRRSGNAPATAGTESPAAGVVAAPSRSPTATPAAGTAAPAPVVGPVAEFVAWADATKPSAEAGRQRTDIAAGLRLLADALQERMPLAGAQIVLTRAMADSLELPAPTPNQVTNAAQAAFFAVAYAMRATPPGDKLNERASEIQLNKPLTQQNEQVQRFFATARSAMQDPTKSLSPKPAALNPSAAPVPAPAAKP